MRKNITYTLAAMLSLLIVACLGTGTVTFKYDFNEFYTSSDIMHKEHVDLTTNSDYNDNKDRIKSIDQVSVVGWFINEEPVADSAEIFVSEVEYEDPETVRENATRVFSSPTIPGNDSIFVDWADALAHIENLPYLKDRVDNGQFWLYGLAANAPFTVRCRITLIITFTVGL
jgi:hypothetical protein